jgi:energy-coupling factor transporter ATP-binding protein EcfA2
MTLRAAAGGPLEQPVGQTRPEGKTMEAKIEKGRALVLVGPQGCGKTKLAIELAKAVGPYQEIELSQLEDPFQNWMAPQIETVVVEGFPDRPALLNRVRQWVSASHMEVNRKMRPVEIMRTPNFVFCTGDPEPLKHLEGRRFHVVDLAAAG